MAEDSHILPEADRADGCPHPRETYDLMGHQQAEKRFLNAIRSGRMHHAWLITGPSGCGKATLAYRMIRHILGGQSLLPDSLDIPASDPVAQRIQALGHGDFFLLRRPYDLKTKKLRSEIPVSETRRLRDFFTQKSAEGGWRVCLIDSADELNRNAENGVLKTLEEPPEKTILILISSAPGRLLPTIRSRCLNMSLRAVSEAEIKPWLRRRIDAGPEIIDVAVKLSGGAPGRAFALAQNADAVLKPFTRFLSGLGRDDMQFDHQLANALSAQNAQHARMLFWDALQTVLQAQAIFSLTQEWNGAFQPLPITKPPERWRTLWQRAGFLQEREAALNMDKKTVMLDMFTEIRAT